MDNSLNLPPKVKLSRSSYNELNRKIKEAEILNYIARESNLRNPVNQVLRKIAPDLRQILPLRCCTLFQLESDKSQYNRLSTHQVYSECIEQQDGFREMAGEALNQKQILTVKSCCRKTREQTSHIVIPVIRNDKAFGAIFMCYTQPWDRTPSAERFLQQLADQVAVSLENLQLYEDVLHGEIEKLNLVGELAAGAAHEIRNPLTSIRGFVQLLQDSIPQVSDKRDYFPIMLDEIDRIEQIITELLLLAKPLKHNWTKVNIKDVLSSLQLLIESQATLNDIEFEMSFGKNLPQLYMDSDQLKQVFLNLIQNAIEAMPEGGKLTVTVKHSYGFITVEVKDTGVGIPPDCMQSIFYPFFTTKDKEKGTGLGLSISSRIIKSFGGTIDVKSVPKHGTVFTVRLPHA